MTAAPFAAFAALSDALAAAVAAAAGRVAALRAGGDALSAILWAEGLVVAAEEALRHDEGLALRLPDGREVSGELAGRDPSTDVALIRADTGPVAAWESAAAPAPGALALAVGRGPDGPLAALAPVAETGGAWRSARGGRIDALVRLGAAMPRRIEGGAVVAADGRLIGLAAADPRRRGLAIPAATVARAVAALAEKGYVARGYLGLGLRPLRARAGLLVAEVADGGPGAAAGLLVGDVVATWNGEAVGGMRDLARRLGTDAVGASARLGLIRAGAPAEATVVVGERPRAGGAA
jgi:S1-C subfamily serine protease